MEDAVKVAIKSGPVEAKVAKFENGAPAKIDIKAGAEKAMAK